MAVLDHKTKLMFHHQIVLSFFLLVVILCDCYIKAIKPLELLTALLEYLNCFYGIVQSTDFLAVKALLLPQNANIIPNAY